MTQFYDRHLLPSGLTVTQFAILARLDRYGPLTINQLAARLGMDRTTLGRTLKPLQRDGLVAAASDPSDGRRRALSPTEAGRDRLAAALPLWSNAQAGFEDLLGSGASQDLRAVLDTLLVTDLGSTASVSLS